MAQKAAAEKIAALFQKKYIQILVLCLLGMIFCLFSGRQWVYLIDDSFTYLNPGARDYGVMPIYPVFLFIVKFIFGENLYLSAVVVIQSVVAVFCTLVFTLYLQRIFRLKFSEMILFYAFTMLPFAIDLPEACVSHMILTEGIAYPFFYIYFIFLLQYIFYKKNKWLLAAVVMAVFMGLIRSQLLLLLIVTTLIFVCVEFAGKEYGTKIMRWVKAGVNLIIGGIGSCILVFCIYQCCTCYANYLVPAINRWENRQEAVENEGMQESIEKESMQAVVENESRQEAAENEGVQEAVESESVQEEIVKAESAEPETIENKETMSQLTNLIIIKGFYEADEEDADLFDTAEMQEIFRRVYAAVDEQQYRYEYAGQGLYMWRDLVKDRIVVVAQEAIATYLNDNPDVKVDVNAVLRELGMKVLLRHFDRYLYHSIRLIIPGFISSIFFQIERIYWLCHLITLFLFSIEIFGIIYCLKNNRERKTALFASATVGFIFLMVVIISLVFGGTQRYLVYAMGIFYCSLYLLLKEWGLPWIKKTLKL